MFASDEAASAKTAADKADAVAQVTAERTAKIAETAREELDRAKSVVEEAFSEVISARTSHDVAKTSLSVAVIATEKTRQAFWIAGRALKDKESLLEAASKSADEAEAAAKRAAADKVTASVKFADAAIAGRVFFAQAAAFDAKFASDEAASAKIAADEAAADALVIAERTAKIAETAREEVDRAKSVVEEIASELYVACRAEEIAETNLTMAASALKAAKSACLSAKKVVSGMKLLSETASKIADEAEAAAKLTAAKKVAASIKFADAALAAKNAFAAVGLLDGKREVDVVA